MRHPGAPDLLRGTSRYVASWLRALLLVLFALAAGAALAQTPSNTERAFDHALTGYALTGQHVQARCESCHIQGVFRGTPRDCSACHRTGSRVAAIRIPETHIQTVQDCDVCHRTQSWTMVVFTHQGVNPGNCASCHNGVSTTGKPAVHPVTTASCDACHRTLNWQAATFDHTGVVAGTCTTCHGATATGKPATHVVTTASCDACHTTLAWRPASYVHDASAVGKCSSCHNGTTALGKGPTHIPDNRQCDVCHTSTTSFVTRTMDHTGLAGQCATCHSGKYTSEDAQTWPGTSHQGGNPPAQCDTCHKTTTTWATATADHSKFTPAVIMGDHTCSTCHKNGGTGLPAPTNHIPTAAACDTCHANFVAFRPAVMNHSGTTGQCSTCHNGTYIAIGTQGALAKPTTHIATNAQCDVCHTTTAWKPATYAHDASAVGQCSTCHNGSNAMGKGSTHVPDNRQCDTCHTSTTSFLIRTMNHTGLNGQCSTCHNGSYVSEDAQTKHGDHLPTSAQCDTCHKSTTTWATATFDHSSIGSTACATCHNNVKAQGKPTNHIPTTGGCDTCHTNFVAFRPAVMNHTGTSGQCSTCHSGDYVAIGTQGALAKPATHVATTAQCDACHNTSAWRPASYSHDSKAAGNCATCHNGVTATGKGALHIPDSRQCDVCHTSTTSFQTRTMNHTGLSGKCSVCHSGSYLSENAQTWPGTSHQGGNPPAQCDSCHKSTTTWATAAVDHSKFSPPVTIGGHACATCHKNGGTGLPPPTNHIPTSAACDYCHSNFTAFKPGTMDHSVTGIAGNCSTCHNGTYVAIGPQGALAKTATHIPTAVQCDACHVTFVAFKPAVMNHSVAGIAGNCSACHSGAYTAANAQAKPSTHIATTTDCGACHGTTAWKPAAFAHDASSVGKCSSCHNGTTAMGKGATHIVDNRQCDTCHSSYLAFTSGTTMNHTGLGNQCSTCHSGTYVSENAQTWPGASHQGGNPPAQCDSCHKSTTTWATATTDHSKFTPAVSVGDHSCSTCHKNGGTGLPPPTNHIPTAAACDYCHTNFTGFKPANMDHAVPGIAGSCATCHNGSYVSVGTQGALAKTATHIPTTVQCDGCHTNFVAFKPSPMNHSVAGVSGSCATCHSGAYLSAGVQGAQTKSATHISTTAQCDVCHTTSAWKPATFTHDASTAGKCSTCHNGTTALGKGGTHIPDNRQCDTCHTSTTSFLTRTMNHTGLTSQCSTCHGGSYISENAQTWPGASHQGGNPPAQCDSCHKSTTSWATATTDHSKFTPPVTIGGHACATCHKNGGSGLPPPTNHIPTSAACDYCHSNFTAFKPGTMNHSVTGIAGNCSSCHNGAYVSIGTQGALAKPASHIPTGAQCDSCHAISAWLPITVYAHAGIAAGTCSTCHGGSYVNIDVKPITHVTTTASCDSCHKTTAWKPAAYTHDSSATGKCSTCHNGTTALGKGGTHIPDNRQCDTCHTSYVAFTSGTTMNHTGLANQCSTCHSGSYLSENAQTWSATHAGGNPPAQCDTCHKSTTSWASASVDHSKFTPAVTVGGHTCATCHKNGGTGLPPPTNHIPTTAACDYCHSNFTAFKPGTMNHSVTGIAGNCSSCHNGSYVSIGAQGALAKPASHITTAVQCDSCHTTVAWLPITAYSHTGIAAGTCSTCHGGSYANIDVKTATHVATTASCDSCHKTSAWKPAGFTHDSSAIGKCSTCHNGTTALGKGGTHIPDNRQCDTCHTSYVAFTTGTTMNHTGLGGQCSTCHSGSYLSENAQTWPGASHQGGNPPAQCDTCHKSTTSWASATTTDHSKFTPPVTIGGHACATCHKNGGTGLPPPTNHIPTTVACDYCHSNFTAFKPATMNHSVTGIAGNCSTCHNGSYVSVGTQGALAKPASHITTSVQCDSCHTTAAWLPITVYSHSGIAAGTCSTCHGGSYANIDVKTVTHVVTTASCDSCHNTGAWKPAGFAHDSSATGKCSTCHNGTTALGKGGTHIPDNRQCDTCHTSTTSFLTRTMNHTGLASQCSTCHSGSYVSENAQTWPGASHQGGNPPAQCDTCHLSTTSWATAGVDHSKFTPPVTIGGHACATCHKTGGSGLPPPSNHIPTTVACDYCHSNFTAFKPGTMNHSVTGIAGNCSTCHNGSYTSVGTQGALPKPASHITTTVQCDTCHRTTTWLPLVTPYAHTGVAAGTCSTCHGGSYVNIDVKPAAHIPTSSSCDVCHKTVAWSPFITPFPHPGIVVGDGSCGNCHSGSYAGVLGKPATGHIPATGACDSCHKSLTTFLGATYSHSGVAAGTCNNCHNGTYPGVMAKSSNHIPTTTVSASWSSCDACHKNTTSFSGVKLHSTVFTSASQYPGTCALCHERGNPYGVTGRPSKHSSGDKATKSCDASGCHSVKSFDK